MSATFTFLCHFPVDFFMRLHNVTVMSDRFVEACQVGGATFKIFLHIWKVHTLVGSTLWIYSYPVTGTSVSCKGHYSHGK